LPDKSKVFQSRSLPCLVGAYRLCLFCLTVAYPLLPQDRRGSDDATDDKRGQDTLDPPRRGAKPSLEPPGWCWLS